MREPMTLLEQSNAFKKSNGHRLVINRTVRCPPVYSSLNTADDSNIELKTLSVDVYTSKHLVTPGKSILPYTGRNRLNELILQPIEKEIDDQENRRRRKKKRPTYRQSLYHSDSSNTTQADLAQLTARGLKRQMQTTIPTEKDDDTVVSYQNHHNPPPSPSDDEIGRLLFELQNNNQSRPPSRQSSIEKEEYIPFRLPALQRSAQLHHKSTHIPTKDIRSTLSNYLRKYY